jgi:hypothetical protein
MIAKGRNIGTGSFILRFNEETTAFYDYDGRLELSPEFSCNPDEFIEAPY